MKQRLFTSIRESRMSEILPPDVHLDHGWGHGYVHLPVWHTYYGVHFMDIPYEVHGGLNYSEYEGTYWVIGFDTNHYGDTMERWPEEAVLTEANYLLHQALMTPSSLVTRYWRVIWRTPAVYWRQIPFGARRPNPYKKTARHGHF